MSKGLVLLDYQVSITTDSLVSEYNRNKTHYKLKSICSFMPLGLTLQYEHFLKGTCGSLANSTDEPADLVLHLSLILGVHLLGLKCFYTYISIEMFVKFNYILL